MIILRFTFTIFKIVHAAHTAVLHYFKSSPQAIPQLLTPLPSLLTKKTSSRNQNFLLPPYLLTFPRYLWYNRSIKYEEDKKMTRYLLIAALLPAAALLFYVRKLDKIEAEPSGMIMKLCGFGALTVISAVILETLGGAVLGAFFPEDSLIVI